MGKTILFVDDSASMRQVVGMALRSAGYEVIEAVDGNDALGKLRSARIHLMITDLNMPNMDGITLIKEVKQLPHCRFTPIVMLTTEAQEEKKRQGQAAGAKAWIVKPFRPEQLLAVVEKVVG